MINAALVGFGYSAQTFHLPFLRVHSDFNLLAVMSSQKEKVASMDANIRCYGDIESLVNDKDIELVIITAPNDVHFSLAKECLNSGKHVVLEKPFVTRVEDGKSLIELADKNNCVLTVFHNRRWDGDFLTVKSLIESKRLGQVKYFESHFDRFRPLVRDRWREHDVEGGGIWFDLGPHLLDQVLSLFGLPFAVTGRLSALREGSPTVDYFHVLLHYKTHEVILQSSPFCASETLRFHVQGEAGNYVKMGLDPQEDTLKEGIYPDAGEWALRIHDVDGVLNFGEENITHETLSGDYMAFFNQLAAAILEGGSRPVLPQDALKVIELVKLIEKSSEEGRRIEL